METGANMKKIVLVVLLLSAFSFAANKPANPADYNVKVHVSASSLGGPSGASSFLNVLIDGKNYQLSAQQHADGKVKGWAVIALGDYKARLVTDEHNAYEFTQVYEFLLPDGKTRKFGVVGTSE
jgi:hypothetical protein